ALRIGVVHQDVGSDVPGEVAAALGAVEYHVLILGVDAGRPGVATIRDVGATQRRRVLGSDFVLVVFVPAGAGREGEDFRDQVEVESAERRELMVGATDVFTESNVVSANAGVRSGRTCRRAHITDARRAAREGSCQIVRGTGRDRLVREIHVVRDFVV